MVPFLSVCLVLALVLHGWHGLRIVSPARVCVDIVKPSLHCPAPMPSSDVDAAAELTPALLVLNKLVLASEESREAVKRAIFPPEADEVCVRPREQGVVVACRDPLPLRASGISLSKFYFIHASIWGRICVFLMRVR